MAAVFLGKQSKIFSPFKKELPLRQWVAIFPEADCRTISTHRRFHWPEAVGEFGFGTEVYVWQQLVFSSASRFLALSRNSFVSSAECQPEVSP
ncbi:MAG: hypothetical protein R2788_22625 [Saprospiraceae bacterium]